MPPRGFTVLELLVVLVIMGLAAGVVPMAWRAPATARASASWPDVVTTARRLALERGQPVELRLDGDGHWVIVGAASGDALRLGHVALPSSHPAPGRWHVDALGLCRPLDTRDGRSPFDMAACRESASAPSGGVGGATP